MWGLELYGAAGVLINADGFLEVHVHVEMITMIVITTMMTTIDNSKLGSTQQ